MEAVGWSSLGDLENRAKLSNEILRVLSGMSSWRGEDVANIPSYLAEALRIGQRSGTGTHRFLYEALAQQDGIKFDLAPFRGKRLTSSTPLSLGLSRVFVDAFHIRDFTGGKDEYIGARHIAFSLITSRDAQIRDEISIISSHFNMKDLSHLSDEFSFIIKDALESDEDVEAWRKIFVDRGFTEALVTFEGDESERSTASFQRRSRSAEKPEFQATIRPPSAPKADESDIEPQVLNRHTLGPRLIGQINPIAGIRNDDPRALPPGDMVGVDGAAAALARVVAARNFEPPLAVGVFGPWGSGKSFFMRRLEGEIEQLRERPGDTFHTEIVEVRFNAWHYVDTNLWANLVGEIFETLERRSSPQKPSKDGVLNQLSTARSLTLTTARDLAAKRQGARAAKEDLRRAELELEKKRESIPAAIVGLSSGFASGWKRASEDQDVKKLIDSTYGQPLEALAAQWAKPEIAIDALKKDGAVWLQIRRTVWGWGLFGSFVVAGFLWTLPLWLHHVLGVQSALAREVERIGPFALAASGLLTSVTAWVGRTTAKAVKARDTVVAAIASYKKAIDAAQADKKAGLGKAQSDYDAANVNVEAARLALDEAISIQAQATVALKRETPAERLRAFVRAKASIDGPYLSQQGLIGTIRRDFADLSNLMSLTDGESREGRLTADNAFEAAISQLQADYPDVLEPDELTAIRGSDYIGQNADRFDRIVLYIDDLDRCPADKVLDVLQAVHLLMAFKLFVVIVAVDVRWLEAALEDRHKQFGRGSDDPKALEYLEKIFQLAIWTPELTAPDVATFVRQRLQASPDENIQSELTDQAADTGVDSEQRATDDAHRQPEGATAEAAEAAKSATQPDPNVAEISSHRPLHFTPAEINLVERVCGSLSMTPRRVLRLINSYQVARASLSEQEADALADRGHANFVSLLALSVAAPDRVLEVMASLRMAKSWPEFEASLSKTGNGDLVKRIAPWLKLMLSEGLSAPELAVYIPVTLRFSFVGPVAFEDFLHART